MVLTINVVLFYFNEKQGTDVHFEILFTICDYNNVCYIIFVTA